MGERTFQRRAFIPRLVVANLVQARKAQREASQELAFLARHDFHRLDLEDDRAERRNHKEELSETQTTRDIEHCRYALLRFDIHVGLVLSISFPPA